ncbi:hypothetical protein [Mycobacterium sp. HUMS_1102779]|uniref:hypothetical protein n=1 Tax=Mycobacterium sp. HUMS_1102779 TaxID=3383487 RepID=UPI00389A343B
MLIELAAVRGEEVIGDALTVVTIDHHHPRTRFGNGSASTLKNLGAQKMSFAREP